jgi:inorganic triphosphatase YgiF
MKLSIAFALAALMITGFLAAGTQQASAAVIYCQYVDYPAGCVARPGVVLRVRPVAGVGTVGVGAAGVGVRPGTPANRGGPVDRAGRR